METEKQKVDRKVSRISSRRLSHSESKHTVKQEGPSVKAAISELKIRNQDIDDGDSSIDDLEFEFMLPYSCRSKSSSKSSSRAGSKSNSANTSASSSRATSRQPSRVASRAASRISSITGSRDSSGTSTPNLESKPLETNEVLGQVSKLLAQNLPPPGPETKLEVRADHECMAWKLESRNVSISGDIIPKERESWRAVVPELKTVTSYQEYISEFEDHIIPNVTLRDRTKLQVQILTEKGWKLTTTLNSIVELYSELDITQIEIKIL